jgi:hypothetical protein
LLSVSFSQQPERISRAFRFVSWRCVVTHLGAMQHIEARLERDELLGRDHFLRLCHRFVKLGLHLLTLPGKTALFLSFPYVCPEPVLVK